jgi:plastocyanin
MSDANRNASLARSIVMWMRRCAAPGLTLAVVIVLALAQRSAADVPASPTAAAAPTVVVHIHNYLFVPEIVTIHPGQSVEWIEDDDDAHTATAVDTTWDSGRLDKGQTFTRVFSTAGTFSYDCAYHEYMRGKVIVTE